MEIEPELIPGHRARPCASHGDDGTLFNFSACGSGSSTAVAIQRTSNAIKRGGRQFTGGDPDIDEVRRKVVRDFEPLLNERLGFSLLCGSDMSAQASKIAKPEIPQGE